MADTTWIVIVENERNYPMVRGLDTIRRIDG